LFENYFLGVFRFAPMDSEHEDPSNRKCSDRRHRYVLPKI